MKTFSKHCLLKYKVILLMCISVLNTGKAQVLFDFNSTPIYTPFPITITSGTITAHFDGTGQSYSIQDANTMGFTPVGFNGNCVYPSSVYLSDLLISFDQLVTHFSIMYSAQELGCDDAATLRITAFANGITVGTSTTTCGHPGTWPVDTINYLGVQGFDSIVIHYDSPPPTCQDYGVIYLADNMYVTPFSPSGILIPENIFGDVCIVSEKENDFLISFSLAQNENMHASIVDITGRLVAEIFSGNMKAGKQLLKWNTNEESPGIYFLRLSSDQFVISKKIVVMK